jgi:hypothetical protein
MPDPKKQRFESETIKPPAIKSGNNAKAVKPTLPKEKTVLNGSFEADPTVQPDLVQRMITFLKNY